MTRPGFYQTGRTSAVECNILLLDGSSVCQGGSPCLAQRLGLQAPEACHGTFGTLFLSIIFHKFFFSTEIGTYLILHGAAGCTSAECFHNPGSGVIFVYFCYAATCVGWGGVGQVHVYLHTHAHTHTSTHTLSRCYGMISSLNTCTHTLSHAHLMLL